MASKARSKIISLLNREDESADDSSDTGIEDHVSEDDIQSDTDVEYIDEIIDENLNDTSTPLENPTNDHRIITAPHRVNRGKNRHVWATCKGQSSGRTSTINIVRSNRGPSRMCRNIFNHLYVLNYLSRMK